MSNHLKRITTKAKALYRSGRYAKWTDAIKAASKKVGSPAASKKVRSAAKKAKVRLPHGYKTVKAKRLGTIAGHTSALRNMLENKMARLLIKRDLHTKRKSDKKKISKELAAVKKQIKNL